VPHSIFVNEVVQAKAQVDAPDDVFGTYKFVPPPSRRGARIRSYTRAPNSNTS
jgi:hypothetical protein